MPEDNGIERELGRADRQLIPATDNLPSTEMPEDTYGYLYEEKIHLRNYLNVIMRRKWLITSVLAICFLSSLILTLASPKLYKASTYIQVAAANQNVTNFKELISDDFRSRELYQTQIQLLQSETLAQRVIKKLDLANHPIVKKTLFETGKPGAISKVKVFLKDFVEKLISAIGAKENGNKKDDSEIAEDALKQRMLVGFIAKNLKVSPNRNSMIIEISFTSPDRKLSMNVANTLAEEFILWKMQQKLDASQLAQDFLTKQIDRAKINLEKVEEELNQFAKQARIVSLDSKLNVVYRQLEELNSALAQAEAELIGKEAVYRQATKDKPSNLSEVLKNNVITNLKSEYARLRSEYEELTTTFRGDYPKVKPLKSRMLSLAARIEAEEDKIIMAIKNDYLTASKKVETLQTRVDRQKKLAMDLNERTTQYRIMERQVETNKGIYDSLLQRAREIESMVGISSSDIQIVDPAVLPIFQFKPKVKMNLLLAIVVGLSVGISCAFLLEYFSDKITNPEEVSDRFRIPVLGLAPLVKKSDHPIEEMIVADPRAPFSEAMRTIMISIQLSGLRNHSKSFLLSSAMPGEGKTTLAVNLALTFAGAGEKVILIDADMRKPRVHQILTSADGINRQGLSSFLAGLEDECHVCHNGHDNFCFVPTGPLPPNPVELLASARFEELIDFFGQHYDRIIVDGPPMTGLADMIVLSQRLGGVLLVSTMGETTRRDLRHIKKSMANVGANILGCIINKVDFSNRYGYASCYKRLSYYNPDYRGNIGRTRRKLLRKN